jgi:crossover junction endodeoxyribonuclease RuvC
VNAHPTQRQHVVKKILGIDPGSLCTGWGVIEAQGPALRALGADVIRTNPRQSIEKKLSYIYERLREVITQYQPTAIAVESIFFSRYAQAALQLGHVRGVVLLCAEHASCPVYAYPPAIIKRTLTGRGRAEKDQVARMTAAILKVKVHARSDANDALALAVTHALARPFSKHQSLGLKR